MEVTDLIGKTIVGYRYGEAPQSGHSWNYTEDMPEPGVSMAQVGYYKEYSTFAVTGARASRKRVYYVGEIAGEGSDDEICLRNVRRISYREYLRLRIETKQVSNDYVNALCDRYVSLLNGGWHICKTYEQVEEMRRKYTKK